MCDDIIKHGKRAAKEQGGVHHKKARSMAGYANAVEEFPEQFKPDNKELMSDELDGSEKKLSAAKAELEHAQKKVNHIACVSKKCILRF